ncbi:hypothetical protein G6F65_018666 [Rhizopus arrhizus]|nr:hypothetical protein G6F65_018666 [Rhizopus arrhizus]
MGAAATPWNWVKFGNPLRRKDRAISASSGRFRPAGSGCAVKPETRHRGVMKLARDNPVDSWWAAGGKAGMAGWMTIGQ